MGRKNKSAKRRDGLRIRRIRDFISRNTLLNLVLLSVLFTCFWAVPAFAEEAAVDEAAVVADTGAPAPAETAAEAAEAEAPAAEPEVPAADSEPAATAAEAPAPDPEPETTADTAAAPETGGGAPAEGDVVADTAAQDQNPVEEPCEECAESQALQQEAADCEEALQFLELICGDGFWDSIDDYNNGLLSIEYTLTNTSTDTAVNNLVIVNATANNGVKVNGDLPIPLGSLPPGEVMFFVLKWQVPKGVGAFVTDISICGDCQEVCTDCDPEPVCEENCDPPIEEEKQPPVPEVEHAAAPATPVMASVLPETGIDPVKPVIFGLGLVMLGSMVPVARRAYRRIR